MSWSLRFAAFVILISSQDAIKQDTVEKERRFSFEKLSINDIEGYRNDPVRNDPSLASIFKASLKLPIASPIGLIHEAYPPGENAVVGIAVYDSFMSG
jgi:hypothetical protein